MVDGCAGVQTMRMKRVGGYKPYEEQPKREGYVDKGESVESALKISGNVNTSRCERRENRMELWLRGDIDWRVCTIDR